MRNSYSVPSAGLSSYILIVTCLLFSSSAIGQEKEIESSYYSNLHEAARAGDLDLIRKLVESDEDVNQKNRYGLTAIYYAADRGHTEAVDLLLKLGADVEVPNEPFYRLSPITMAARKNHHQVVSLLLDSGATCGAWLASWPASLGHTEVVKVLVNKRPNTFTGDTLDQLAGMAKSQNNDELLTFLVEKGAEPKEANVEQGFDAKLSDLDMNNIDGKYEKGPESIRIWARRGSLYLGNDLSVATELKRISETEFSGKGVEGLTVEIPKPYGQRIAVYMDAEKSTEYFVRKSTASTERSEAGEHVTGKWARFRGESGAGNADGMELPVEFDTKSEKGLHWKTKIEGVGHSSPVIWDDRVFITSANPVNSDAKYDLRVASGFDTHAENLEYKWTSSCLDLNSGELIWQKALHQGLPKAQRHIMSSHANCTPTVSADYLIVNLAGEGIICMDHSGKTIWKKDLGRLAAGWFMDPGYEWGFASSPILVDGVVYLQCDVFDGSFITALNVSDGSELWRTERSEISGWGTPLFVKGVDGKPSQLVANGTRAVIGYNAIDGSELWRINGNSEVTVASPIMNHDHVLVTGGYMPIRPIYSIDISQRGDLTPKQQKEAQPEDGSKDASQPKKEVAEQKGLQWWSMKDGAYGITPIVYRDLLYILSSNGVMKVFRADSGELVYKKRIASGRSGDIVASPIAADGKIYVLGGDGDVFVIDAGEEYRKPVVSSVGEQLMASPAAARNRLVIRGVDHVFCFAN